MPILHTTLVTSLETASLLAAMQYPAEDPAVLTLMLVTPFSSISMSLKEEKNSVLVMCLGATRRVSISAPGGGGRRRRRGRRRKVGEKR